MKRILFVGAFALAAVCAFGQSVSLPNLSYTAILNTTCTNTNAACSGAVFAGSGSVPALPQANTGVLGLGSALDIPVPNYNAALVTVNGTYSGSTINFEISDNVGGTNYYQVVCARTDINLLEVSEALPSNQTRAWNCPVWGGYRFRVRQSAFTSGAVNVSITLTQAAIDPSLVVAASITNIAGASDPCQDVSAIKQSVALNISAAGTSQLVALSGTTTVYVCSWSATLAGTTPTLQFEYGTGASCGTGTSALTGTYAPTAGTFLQAGDAATLFKSASGAALCAVAGGTPSIQGVLTYVQQ